MHGHAQMGGLQEGVGWPERLTGNGRFFCRWQGVAFVVPGGPADPGIKGRKGGGRGWFFRRSRAGLVGRDEEGKQHCEAKGKGNQFEFHGGSIDTGRKSRRQKQIGNCLTCVAITNRRRFCLIRAFAGLFLLAPRGQLFRKSLIVPRL